MKKKQGKRHTAEQIIRKLREGDTMLAVVKTIGQMLSMHRNPCRLPSEDGELGAS